MCNFDRGYYRDHSCEIILNLDQWLRRRCCSKKKFKEDRFELKQDKSGDKICICSLPGADLGFRESGVYIHKGVGVHFADFISYFRNIP